MKRVVALLSLAACSDPEPGRERGPDADPPSVSDSGDPLDTVTVTDEGLVSGYQDAFFGEWKRGRTALVGDFDGDGDMDVASGNPLDPAFILVNNTPPGGPMSFEAGQFLGDGILFWGGSANDLDNDGDTDLFVAIGGNDGQGLDYILRNEGGILEDDVLLTQFNANDAPVEQGTAGAVAFDLDNDGLLDVFGNSGVSPPGLVGKLDLQVVHGLNPIWRNNGDGTWIDVGLKSGLHTQHSTRNSALLDFDNDGDIDIFENNFVGPSVLWRNRLAEDGVATFEDVTDAMSLGGGDLRYPYDISSMCSIASDLNNDGWEDLVVFRRRPKEPGEPKEHANTHLVWINVEGTGFVEVANHTILVDGLVYRDHDGTGVMGCQIGDIDADGAPDLFLGNGSPEGGEENQLYVSAGAMPVPVDLPGIGEVWVPQWEDWSSLIRFPAPHELERHGTFGDTYPYRTHGTVIADFDGDGLNELGVHNGGTSTWGSDFQMQEPNRLFKFHFDAPPHWLRVIPRGNGTTVNRDGVGARVRAVVSRGADGERREIHATMRSSTGFGAQNGPEILLGLGRADTVHELEVTWPDGHVATYDVDAVDTRIVLER